jgi:hypothetical protein
MNARATGLAHALVALLFMSACGQQPRPTRPFVESPDPDPRQVLVVDGQALAFKSGNTPIAFSAAVISQDDPDQSVASRLYIDFGSTSHGAAGSPFQASILGSSVGSGTLDETRRVVANWFPAQVTVDPGCHTATLVVSHGFDDSSNGGLGCPLCDSDASMITWHVLRCDSASGNCNDLPIDGCASLTNTCAQARMAAHVEENCSSP